MAHVVNGLLGFGFRNSYFFYVINFIEGLVAPAFLFAAGASFSIILSKRKTDILFYRRPAIKQTFRALQILALAYMLHIPFKTLVQCQTIMTRDEYLYFVSFDVLQTIAFGLITLQIFYIIIRNDNLFYRILLILSILIIIVTPNIWQYDFSAYFPPYIATVFNNKLGSLFPLFPWLSYVYLGCFVSNLLLNNLQIGNEEKTLQRFSLVGFILVFVSASLELLSIKTSEYYNFWFTSPNIIMIRFGSILIFLHLLWFAGVRFKYRMRIFGVYGKESLIVYIVHLIIVYGSALGLGLVHYYGSTLNWSGVALIYLLVLITMLILAYLWNYLKLNLNLFARIILISTFSYFLFYFFTKPF